MTEEQKILLEDFKKYGHIHLEAMDRSQVINYVNALLEAKEAQHQAFISSLLEDVEKMKKILISLTNDNGKT